MMKRMIQFCLAMITFACALSSAQAQTTATFISATGTDAGTCTLTQPCRNLTFALTQTATNGIITMLDSGTYAAATITKGITIQAAPGVAAVIEATSGNALTIGVGTTNFVTLRNLQIEGGGTGNMGIQSSSAGGVQIENCTIRNFANVGIQLTGNAGKHSVTNSVVQHCNVGIVIAITTGSATTSQALLDGCRIEKSGSIGISVVANGTNNKVRTVIANTTTTSNVNHGLSISGNATSTTDAILENCLVANNGTGLSSSNNGTIRVSNSIITGNNLGISGMVILTRTNNSIDHNTTQGSFSGTFTAK